MKIKIYSTTTCPYCNLEKQYLDSKGIKYENVFVDKDPKAAEEMVKISNQMGVPFTVITKDDGSTATILGFDKAKIDLALKATLKPSITTAGEGPFDVIIIGGGPAGVAAAVYTARKQMKTLLITESFGGQSIVSDDIQNWIGTTHISGLDLAKNLEAHVRFYPEILEIKSPEKVIEVKTIKCEDQTRFCDFEINSDKGKYPGKTVILASGARPRKLGIPGEDKFEGKGVAYCSTCDSPLFVGKKVAVVGGGNSGLETVQDLFPYALEIYLLEYSDSLKGDQKTQEEIKKNPKFKEIILNAKILEILGETLVTGIKYQVNGQEKTLEVGGVFVEVGSIPNSEMVKNLIQLDPHNQVIINFKHATTSHPGIFAAGDVTDDPYKQNNIAVGDGVRAALASYHYLLDRKKYSPAAEKHEIS